MVAGRAEAVVDLPAAPISAAEVALEGAFEQLRAASEVIARATSHLIAHKVLWVLPTAAFLELDEERTEDGPRIFPGAIRDANGVELDYAPEDTDDGYGNPLDEDLDELLTGVDSLRELESSPAVDDPVVRLADGRMGAHRQYRIDLAAALALYPTLEPTP